MKKITYVFILLTTVAVAACGSTLADSKNPHPKNEDVVIYRGQDLHCPVVVDHGNPPCDFERFYAENPTLLPQHSKDKT